jgi:hypothetical protein
MDVAGFWEVFAAGSFGGVLLEILRWWRLRESSELPTFSNSPLYWSITLAMICAGGALATLYGVDTRNALMVTNIGASAPALIAALATPGAVEVKRTTRSIDGAADSRLPEIRRFLAFGYPR